MSAATIEFTAWPKTPRLFREVVVTEKIDGTNAAVGIRDDGTVYAQSRSRIVTPDADNFGFAAWVAANAGTLTGDLGPGLHFGEWWGNGIQRGYGLAQGDKRFSLFNVKRFGDDEFYTPGVRTVPNLGAYTLDTTQIRDLCDHLADNGSYAAPGFMRPEGLCIFHTASRQVFKVTLEGDEAPKGATA